MNQASCFSLGHLSARHRKPRSEAQELTDKRQRLHRHTISPLSDIGASSFRVTTRRSSRPTTASTLGIEIKKNRANLALRIGDAGR
ncbi:MAG TPA: hypothetical protein PKN13_00195 [Accumulibacter sp.]|nr:hypothetical protein [Accumulibacter sp.]HMW16290.1 hypothetical protein [Accumulibacter sp.]HMX22171.1 hypothetical protein [Accumulibacter sp.]HMY05801.1 hypothetical protein [Accumulibacter sp.]HNC16947.1 hypothetical protein [Accumulibacter sp.]